MFIRTAGERDLAEVSALLAETWHATYDPIYGIAGVSAISGRWHSVDWLRRMLRRASSEFIVADSGAGLAGMAYAVINEKQRDVVELQELDVRPAMQGRGIGGLLLDEMVGSFYESRLMRLDVEERNHRTVAFYQAADFMTVSRRPATQGVDAMILIMERRFA